MIWTFIAKDEDVAVGGTKQIRHGMRHVDILHWRKNPVAIEHLNPIIPIPVACHDHTSAVQFYTRGKRALHAHNAEASERVCLGVVFLHIEASAHAHRV